MKEKQIAKLLREGKKPADLVHQGFSRGAVYKTNRRLQHGSATPSDPSTTPGFKVENDPEAIQLKKAVRMAELQRQLGEIEQPVELVDRIAKLEEEVRWLRDESESLYGEFGG